MPESRGRRSKSKAIVPLRIRQETIEPPRKTLREKIRDHSVPWFLGLIAAILAIGEPIRQALLAPEISVDSAVDLLKPFAVSFSVKNESWLFAMRRANLNCFVDEVSWRGGGEIAGTNILDARRANIAPGDNARFVCSLEVNAPAGTEFELARGHLRVSVNYRTLLFSRQPPGTDFTWLRDNNPPHWVKGVSTVSTP
jgi:hypothetical protein